MSTSVWTVYYNRWLAMIIYILWQKMQCKVMLFSLLKLMSSKISSHKINTDHRSKWHINSLERKKAERLDSYGRVKDLTHWMELKFASSSFRLLVAGPGRIRSEDLFSKSAGTEELNVVWGGFTEKILGEKNNPSLEIKPTLNTKAALVDKLHFGVKKTLLLLLLFRIKLN